MIVIVWLAFAMIAAVSALHAYWAFGGVWGARAAIPGKPSGGAVFVPGRAATLTVALMLAAAGWLLLAQSGLWPAGVPSAWTKWGCIACGAVFFVRSVGDFNYVGFAKKVKGTAFARNDTRLYSPLCLFLSAAYGITAFYPSF